MNFEALKQLPQRFLDVIGHICPWNHDQDIPEQDFFSKQDVVPEQVHDVVPEQAHGIVPRKRIPRLSALLIGINDYNYAEFRSLRGAESDALDWNDFLLEHLAVPRSQITMLLGRSATRHNILKALNNLADNDSIEDGDPMFIFYAGHGGEVKRLNEMIQVIVPADFYREEDDTGPVYCISDIEIGGWIDHIAAKKGDNITVIMDCCHAASGTRGDDDDERRIRSGPKLLPSTYLFPDLDPKVHNGTLNFSSDPSRAGLKSHMLLAACASTEKAHESGVHGEFSAALLDLFRRVSIDQIRYSEVLAGMKSISKYCEGVNQRRFLFDGKLVSRPLFNRHKIKFRRTGSEPFSHDISTSGLVLEAGSAHGITVGAEFNIYAADDTSLEKVIGTATVASVDIFSASMIPSPGLELTSSSVALQVRPGKSEDFRLFIPQDDKFLPIFNKIVEDDLKGEYQLQNITLVAKETSMPGAHLQASMGTSDEVTFELKDRRVTQFNLSRRFLPVDGKDLKQVALVLARITHYYRELNREAPKSSLSRDIELEFYKLGPKNQWDWRKLTPEGPNLFRQGVIDLVRGPDPYGIKLINNGCCDLYPYFFYFDNNDLSIASFFEPPGSLSDAYTVESPLKAKSGDSGGSLTLGYGSSGGVPPCMFTALKNENVNVDFFKIIITTKPIDLSNTSFPSPFKTTRSLSTWTFTPPDLWHTLLIPVIQRDPRKTRQRSNALPLSRHTSSSHRANDL